MRWLQIAVGLVVSFPLFLCVLFAVTAPYWFWLEGKDGGTHTARRSDGTLPHDKWGPRL